MSASPVFAVAAAAPLERKHGEALRRVHRHVFTYRGRLCAMHHDPHLVQPGERARADAADDNCIYLLIVERLHRVARSMRVVLVLVIDR